MGRERVDHFVGASRDRAFKAAQRPICSKGEQSTVAAGLVKRVEHKFEKRQRSGIGNCRRLQHVLQPALIGGLLKAQAGGACRLTDDLSDLRAGRRQQLVAAQPVLQRGKARNFTAAVKEIRADRPDHPDEAAASQASPAAAQALRATRVLSRW